MKIGDLAAATGVSVRMLRYYEEQGLLTTLREPSGHRRFDGRSVVTVGRVRALLDAGLPVKTIRQVMPCVVVGDVVVVDECVADLLREQLGLLDERIDGPARARAALATVIDSSRRAPVQTSRLQTT